MDVDGKKKSGRKFDMLSEIVDGKENIRIKVRVIRMWNVPTFLNPSETNTVELVFVDEKGGKIHATIRKQLLYMFQSKIEEGEVYEMSYFSVFPERGYYRTTLHPFKLIFQMKTKVKLSQSADISYHGLSLTDISEVCAHTHDYEFLVDVIGVMTGMSVVREYVRDGKMTKMVIIELTDHSGKCECALFGEYVDDLNKKFGKGHDNQPVVIIQFAKVKIFRDKTSIQNVMNTTRIFFNPDIPEYERFKNSIAVHGIETDSIVPLIGGVGKPSMADEFLNMHSKLRITELIENVEYGVFAVFGEVVRIVPGQQWWYAACKCHKAVIPDSGAYYCNGCGKHVFNIVPRFKVKVQVTDGENVCVFTIFDSEMSYMMEKSCAYFVAQSKVSDSGPHPIEFDGLIGKKMLFVVERGGKQSAVPDNSFRVRRMCIDPDIIGKFCAQGRFYTPTKVVDLDFEDASDDGGVDESSGAAGFVDDLIVVPSDVDSEPPNKGSAATTNKKRNGAARGASNGSKRSLCKAFDGVDKDVEKKTDKQIKIEKE